MDQCISCVEGWYASTMAQCGLSYLLAFGFVNDNDLFTIPIVPPFQYYGGFSCSNTPTSNTILHSQHPRSPLNQIF